MASQALEDLETRLQEIDQLIEAHGALTRLQRAEDALAQGGQNLQAIGDVVNHLVTPPGPGRPREVQALNKAGIALLSAHLQGYAEDVFRELATALLDGQVPDLPAMMDNAKPRGNPTLDTINRLFSSVGFPRVVDGVSWQSSSNDTVKARLRALNELRNRIVHGGAETVTKSQLQNYVTFVRNFTQRLDRKLERDFRNLREENPW